MKLIIIIPAYNEEKTIGRVIKNIPRNISGVGRIEILVVDDGSSDRTAREAKKAGADWVLRNSLNRGLASSFKNGLEEALQHNADIILNIDADFQYNPAEIPKLVKPVLAGDADMVIGNRQVRGLKHMPFVKKWGNILLSWLLRSILRNNVSDASCGFRTFSRKCALKIDIRSGYTYTLESIIQATLQGMRIKEVPVEFRKRDYGKSRLIKSLFRHMIFSVITILKTYIRYAKHKRHFVFL